MIDTAVALHAIMDQISTPLGKFRIGRDGEHAFWIQFTLHAPDYAQGGDEAEWHGRKWRISKHMTEREVVGTAFAAVLAAQEHEVREGFTYRGNAVFGPHIPLSALAEASKKEPDARLPMPSSVDRSTALRAADVMARACRCAPAFCLIRMGGLLPKGEVCARCLNG